MFFYGLVNQLKSVIILSYKKIIFCYILLIYYFLIFCYFSYDARSGGGYGKPKEWADYKLLGNRSHFTVSTNPAALVLNTTYVRDEGVYRCRVDFKIHITTHSRINLTVVGE